MNCRKNKISAFVVLEFDAAEQKDEPKPEEKPAENKQTDDNGTAEKTPVINKQTA